MRIHTLTGNLLAEWTFEMASFEPGHTQRAQSMSFQVGGKGINVSRVLGRLGSDTEAIGFADGALAALCTAWLERQRVPHKFFPLAEAGVRPGLVVRESEGNRGETTFLGEDLPVPDTSWKSACQHAASSQPDWLAICGSIPGWRSPWSKAVGRVPDGPNTIRICADTYGRPLEELVRLPIDLVKINRSELDRLFPEGKGLPAREAIQRLRESSPVPNWIITDGAAPITASFGNGPDFEIRPASINEVSPTGSGDTFLAALLDKWTDDSGGLEEALSFAAGCATASAAVPGIGDFPLPLPERFLPEIERIN